MKLSHMSIIYIIIMLPLAVILSTYMQLQIDVVIAKEDLSTKLLDATYDGIISFELNSLSIDNSAGASIKEYVSNAVNTFFDTMSINMGASGGSSVNIQAYVPAILFTSYDGYYIYSPVKSSTPDITDEGIGHETDSKEGKEVIVEKSGVAGGTITEITGSGEMTFKDDNAKRTVNYMVKPFIYYSANYKNSSGDNLVVNYSLDNHIALYAKYGTKKTATKSGYLVKTDNIQISGSVILHGVLNTKNVVSSPDVDVSSADKKVGLADLGLDNWTKIIEDKDINYANGSLSADNADKEISDSGYSKGWFKANVGGNTYDYLIRGVSEINGQDVNIYQTEIPGKTSAGYDHGGEYIIDYTLAKEVEDDTEYLKIKVNDIEIKDKDAKEYYAKAFFFSKWVYKEFGQDHKFNIGDYVHVYDNGIDQSWRTARILVNNQGIEDLGKIFKDTLLFNKNEDPESDSSIFDQHRRQVIQNSIQYNLNSAISTYSNLYARSVDFSMPVLSEYDWNNILNKVSMVVFMQGVPLGGSIWGDYAVATSTNNKLFVNKNNLLFVEADKLSDKETPFHKIDCVELATDKDLYGAMSYEFVYDAKKENVYVYRYNGYKYYKFKDGWYNYLGVKITDSDTPSPTTLKTSAQPLSSAYVRFSGLSYRTKVLYYDTGGDFRYFEYYQYTKTDDGKLKKITAGGQPVDDPKTETHDATGHFTGYKYEYQQVATQEIKLYDHANVGCYWCMMGANYLKVNFFKNFSDDRKKVYFRGENVSSINDAKLKKLDIAWLTYLAKYKNNQFKATDSIQR